MKAIYGWKSGSRFSVDPQPVGEAIAKLRNPTAVDIVTAATDDHNPLHDLFEWDDNEAAKEYRLLTAQLVARSLTVEVVIEDREPVPIRAFECVSQGPRERKQYVPVMKALAKEEWREEVLDRVKTDLESSRRTLRQYSYLSQGVDRAVGHVDAAINALAGA